MAGRAPHTGCRTWTTPIFQKAHFRLIEELGKRYNGHPDLDLVDIGPVGLWGEWHMSGTGVADCPEPGDAPGDHRRLASRRSPGRPR